MALPRSRYVLEGQEGVYHCYCRCVRRAFLCGFDALTHRDFSHRRAWLVDRLRLLATIFAIDVCSYSVMENHYHTILRTRPDIVVTWSNREVATRWLTLFPRQCRLKPSTAPPTQEEIRALADQPERIAILRQRLSSLSWFMGRLNEFIARAANKEDGVKGRFWEARFKCQTLLDDAAIAACMAYVDLNPIRAGLAATPEQCDFTSIQERIRAWRNETPVRPPVSKKTPQFSPSDPLPPNTQTLENASATSSSLSNPASSMNPRFDGPAFPNCWLCPIPSDPLRRGILHIATSEYLCLVDLSGRMMRPHKRGTIDADLAPILLRIDANPNAWFDTVSQFGSQFPVAAGLLSSLRKFADLLGRRRLAAFAPARTAFVPSPTLSA